MKKYPEFPFNMVPNWICWKSQTSFHMLHYTFLEKTKMMYCNFFIKCLLHKICAPFCLTTDFVQTGHTSENSDLLGHFSYSPNKLLTSNKSP